MLSSKVYIIKKFILLFFFFFELKFGLFLNLCVSSLRRNLANLLCIVPVLSDVPEQTNYFTVLVTNITDFSLNLLENQLWSV